MYVQRIFGILGFVVRIRWSLPWIFYLYVLIIKKKKKMNTLWFNLIALLLRYHFYLVRFRFLTLFVILLYLSLSPVASFVVAVALALTALPLTHNLLHIIPGHCSAVKDTPVSGPAAGVCHGGHHLHGGSCPGRLWRRCRCSRPTGTRWLCHRSGVSFHHDKPSSAPFVAILAKIEQLSIHNISHKLTVNPCNSVNSNRT